MPEGIEEDIIIRLFGYFYNYMKCKADLSIAKLLGQLEKFMQRFHK